MRGMDGGVGRMEIKEDTGTQGRLRRKSGRVEDWAL